MKVGLSVLPLVSSFPCHNKLEGVLKPFLRLLRKLVAFRLEMESEEQNIG